MRVRPALATTYEGDAPELLERIAPLVDFIEVTPDAISHSNGGRVSLRKSVLDECDGLLGKVGLIAHGVGLSIGSFDQWNETYLHLIDELFGRFDVAWHSDHLAYTMVAGENIGTMLTLPRTEETVDLICERVRRIQDRFQRPFLLENVIQLLPDAPADYSPAGYLNAIASRTGCGLILDVYNLECDAYNRKLDIAAFLDELDLTAVRELHLAGGVEHEGFRLDIHSSTVSDSTLALGLDIVRRAPNLSVVTYEYLKQATAVLGAEGICAELTRIRRAISTCAP